MKPVKMETERQGDGRQRDRYGDTERQGDRESETETGRHGDI